MIAPFYGDKIYEVLGIQMIKAGEYALSESTFLSECLTNFESDPVEKRKAVISIFMAMSAAKEMRWSFEINLKNHRSVCLFGSRLPPTH